MATYTMTINNLLKLQGFDLGLKDYPIFDENYRETLNGKIVEHFRFCEIGAETPQLFKFYLNRTMAEIMPYYNQLYLSEKIKIDPFNAINIAETETAIFKGSDKGTNTAVSESDTKNTLTATDETTNNTSSSGSTENKNKNLFSQTPSGKLADVEQGKYLTTATFDTSSNIQNSSDSSTNSSKSSSLSSGNSSANTSGTSTIEKDSTNTVTRTRKGNDNSDVLEILKKLRESFLNIDYMILSNQELNDCFMLLWR